MEENPNYPDECFIDDIVDPQEIERLREQSGIPMSILFQTISKQSFPVALMVLRAAVREAKVLLCQTTPAITWTVVEDNALEERHLIQASSIGELLELHLWEPGESTASVLMITDRTPPPRGWTAEEKAYFGTIPAGQERRRARLAAAAVVKADREHYKQSISKWQNVVLTVLYHHLSANPMIHMAMESEASKSSADTITTASSVQPRTAPDPPSKQYIAQENSSDILSTDVRKQPARRKRGGPKSIPEVQKRIYIEGWLSVQEHELQDVYCKGVGISVSALREWMKELDYR